MITVFRKTTFVIAGLVEFNKFLKLTHYLVDFSIGQSNGFIIIKSNN